MPMVVLLLMVVGMTVGVALRRQSSQSLTVARQLRAYQEHHGARGLQEAIGVWIKSQNGRDVTDALGDRGHALDLILADGSIASISLFDGQGQALANLNGLTGQTLDMGGLMLSILIDRVSQAEFDHLTRPVGPVAVSPNSAHEQVLYAAAHAAISDEGAADDVLKEILDRRASGENIGRTELTQIVVGAGVANDERSRFQSLMAMDSELWWVIVELEAGSGARKGQVVSRYGGLAKLRVGRSGGSSGSLSNEAPTPFLSWEDLGVGAAAEMPPGVE